MNRLDDGAGTPSATSAQPQGEHSHAHDGSRPPTKALLERFRLVAMAAQARSPGTGRRGSSCFSAGQSQHRRRRLSDCDRPRDLASDRSGRRIPSIKSFPPYWRRWTTLSGRWMRSSIMPWKSVLRWPLPSSTLRTLFFSRRRLRLTKSSAPLDELLDHALASGVTSLVAPIANTADAILQPAASIVDHAVAPISDVLSIQGDLAVSGTIVLSEAPLAGALPLDDLYSEAPIPPTTSISIRSPSPRACRSRPAAPAVSIVRQCRRRSASRDGHDNTMTPHSLPTNALDELHLRGLGEGVGLI